MSRGVQGPEEARAEASAVNRDILDTLTSLIKLAGGMAHDIARVPYRSPRPARHVQAGLRDPMKELAQRMGCDASFITSVADTLERRGYAGASLARGPAGEVPDPHRGGLAAKERMMREFAEKMPWGYALYDDERRCFLALRKKADGADRWRGLTRCRLARRATRSHGSFEAYLKIFDDFKRDAVIPWVKSRPKSVRGTTVSPISGQTGNAPVAVDGGAVAASAIRRRRRGGSGSRSPSSRPRSSWSCSTPPSSTSHYRNPGRAALLRYQPGVGRQRLHARLRRVAAARWAVR